MAGKIPRHFIDDLLARTDIVEVINDRVPLKKGGKNYLACCPFHQEKSPSFTVTPHKQFYYCFGCGANGNALSFLMDYDRMSFVESIEYLANRAGMEVQREEGYTPSSPPKHQLQPLYDVLDQANQIYQSQLRLHHDRQKAVNYLRKRGLTGQIAKQFNLGLAPPGWDNLIKALPQNDATMKAAVEAGLIIEKDGGRHYDRFRDRIMFPIRNTKGQVIAFGGRVLGDDKPKYLNSPETPVFNKSNELYGLFEALQQRKLEKVVVVEGYMDVIALAQFDIPYAVATLGTATSEHHLRTLYRHVREVIFCFDGDEAGHRAAWRALGACLPNMKEGRQAKFLFLPEGEDPDTFVRNQGKPVFEHQLQTARSLADYLFETLKEQADINTIDGRALIANEAMPLIAEMPETLFREMLIDQLAELSQTKVDRLEKRLVALSSQSESNKTKSHSTNTGSAGRQPSVSHHAEMATGDISLAELDTQPADYDYIPIEEEQTDYGNFDFDSQQPPRRPVKKEKRSVEKIQRRVTSLIDNMIKIMIQTPHLAQKVNLPFEIKELKTPHADLLDDLITTLKQNPNYSTATLFGLWHNTEKGQHLADVAADILISVEENTQELSDALRQLQIQYLEQAIDLEIRAPSPNSDIIRELLKQKHELSSN